MTQEKFRAFQALPATSWRRIDCISTNNHSLSFNSDRSMVISSFYKTTDLTPSIIWKFSNGLMRIWWGWCSTNSISSFFRWGSRVKCNIITKFSRLFAPCRDITQYCKKFPKNSENFEKFRNFVAILGNIATKDQKTSKFRYDIEKYRNKIYCDIACAPQRGPRANNIAINFVAIFWQSRLRRVSKWQI